MTNDNNILPDAATGAAVDCHRADANPTTQSPDSAAIGSRELGRLSVVGISSMVPSRLVASMAGPGGMVYLQAEGAAPDSVIPDCFRRIAASFNACANFSTEDLESIGVGPYMQVRSGQGDNDGVRLIAIERVRQVMEKGWTLEHDDSHTEGELARAAACFALQGVWVDVNGVTTNDFFGVTGVWPWGKDEGCSHPTVLLAERIRNLVKAGALIAAEIDRLHRLRTAPAPT